VGIENMCFIELTRLNSQGHVLINIESIESVFMIDGHARVCMNYDGYFDVEESYDNIKYALITERKRNEKMSKM
jgi:hypothetical protein